MLRQQPINWVFQIKEHTLIVVLRLLLSETPSNFRSSLIVKHPVRRGKNRVSAVSIQILAKFQPWIFVFCAWTWTPSLLPHLFSLIWLLEKIAPLYQEKIKPDKQSRPWNPDTRDNQRKKWCILGKKRNKIRGKQWLPRSWEEVLIFSWLLLQLWKYFFAIFFILLRIFVTYPICFFSWLGNQGHDWWTQRL